MSRGLEVGNKPPKEVMDWNVQMGTNREPTVRVQTVSEVKKSKGFGWSHKDDFLG